MENLRVFKFGGASLCDPDRIRKTINILDLYPNEKIVLVVSAMGKTTNQLENVVNEYFKDPTNALDIFLQIRQNHLNIASELGIRDLDAFVDIEDTFAEGIWLLEDEPHDPYNYVYDQIVSLGELVCSKIIYYFTLTKDLNISYLDARDVIKTDESHRSAKIDWELTTIALNSGIRPLMDKFDILLTQGFIGSTLDNNNTTLGREGSDFTASVIANCLNAVEMIVWKDVDGIMNSDPKLDPSAIKIEKLDYTEMIEMSYFGAKVLHPKTIKPLLNKNILLHVKSFFDPQAIGTTISNFGLLNYPIIKIVKESQCLVKISPKDFSFVSENHLKEIFQVVDNLNIKLFIMRNTALHFLFSTDQEPYKLKNLMEALQDFYNVTIEKELKLITIRHEEILTDYAQYYDIVFEEKFDKTRHLLLKSKI
jgi:aspartate kinase